MTRRSLFTVLLLLGLGSLSGCKPASEDFPERAASGAKRIILLTAHAERPYEAAQRQHLMQLLANQARATLESHDAGGSAQNQAAQFTHAAASRPFAIIIDPIDPAALGEAIREAVASGIVVIGLGQAATAAPCSTVLYCDQTELGRSAGRIAVRALKMKAAEEGQTEVAGRVVEIRGSDESPLSTQRHEGFMEVLKEVPGAILVHDAPGDWTRSGGKDRTVEALRVQGSFDVIYAHNDTMALGAAEGAGDHRENLLIIGTDGFRGPEGGFSLVNNGDIDASVYQPLLVDFAWSILRKKMDSQELALKPAYELAPLAITPKEIDRVSREGLPPFPDL